MGVLPTCISVYPRPWRTGQGVLELELQVIVSCRVVLGMHTWSARAAGALNHDLSLSPLEFILLVNCMQWESDILLFSNHHMLKCLRRSEIHGNWHFATLILFPRNRVSA